MTAAVSLLAPCACISPPPVSCVRHSLCAHWFRVGQQAVFFVSEVETGRADASTGLLLKGEGDFEFQPLSFKDCGFFAPSDVRDLQLIHGNNQQPMVLVGNNNYHLQLFTVK